MQYNTSNAVLLPRCTIGRWRTGFLVSLSVWCLCLGVCAYSRGFWLCDGCYASNLGVTASWERDLWEKA